MASVNWACHSSAPKVRHAPDAMAPLFGEDSADGGYSSASQRLDDLDEIFSGVVPAHTHAPRLAFSFTLVSLREQLSGRASFDGVKTLSDKVGSHWKCATSGADLSIRSSRLTNGKRVRREIQWR